MTAINAVTDLSFDDEVAVITLDSPPVNALSGPLQTGLIAAIGEAITADAAAIVLICAGRTFIAGADITAFGSVDGAAETFAEVQRTLENAPVPIVAAMHGTALGGGLETALCAHYRVAVPSTKLGLPEVHLGLLPGGGGTQRLPRAVGPQLALEMVTSGRHIPASEALAAGLLDALVAEGELRAGAVAYARQLVAAKAPLKRIRDDDSKIIPWRGKPELFADFRRDNARRFRGFRAPEANIACIEAAVNLPFEEGMKVEAQGILALFKTPEAKAQQHSFFMQRAAQKIPDIAPDTPTLPIRKVGVVGAGTMGGGIAMAFANAGLPVTLVEMTRENLDRGLGVIRKTYETSAARGSITAAEAETRANRLSGSLDMADLADADLVIEAVFEDMAVKKQVFGRLDAICRPGAILATNTSFLNVDEIAAATSRPADVIGLHFFSPAHVMKLLEIVRGAQTARPVVATAVQLAKQIGKVGVVVGVCHGFVGNRMLMVRQAQVDALLMAGANPAQIDAALYDFGFPVGPFAMMDVAGLDVLKDAPGQPTLKGAMVAAGRLGQKNGKGFYDYDDRRNASPSAEADAIVIGFRARVGGETRPVTDAEILERTLYVMINEGAKILEEGVATRPSDIDVVWQFGYGWPAWRAGPMYYADHDVGLPRLLERLKALQADHGDAFRPAALLEKLVAEGKTFADWKA